MSIQSLAEYLFPAGNFAQIRANAPDRATYNIESTRDLVQNQPLLMTPFAPAGAAAMSIPYDLVQASMRARDTFFKDNPTAFGITDDAEVPIGPSMVDFASAVAAENPIDSLIERTKGATLGLADRVARSPEFLNNLFFTSAGAGSDVVNLPSIDITNQLADARTIDEESALLDDAFEQQLAEATRTGKLGPFEGIIQNLNPKDAASFITSLLTGGASTALSGVASFADKLGIRRGMKEPPGAVGTGGYGVSRPGNTLTDQTRANRAEFTDFYSNFQGGAQHHMGKRVDDVISRTGSGKRTRTDAQSFVNKYGSQEQKDRFAKTKEQARRDKLTEQFKSEEGDTGGGKSIVCTAMYQTTGLQDWRKAMKIWYIYQKKYLTEAHQKGYHWLFKPFVKGMHKNKIIKMIGAHVAKHRTQHLKHVMFNSKPSLLGKIYNKILEPICYWAGKK